MDVWMYGCMDVWMDVWMDGWMDVWMDGWMDVDEYIDGWMDVVCVGGFLCLYTYSCSFCVCACIREFGFSLFGGRVRGWMDVWVPSCSCNHRWPWLFSAP